MSAQGMTLTVLVTQLVRAYAADTAPEGEGCDIAAGMIGPNVSDWLRDVAAAIAVPAAPALGQLPRPAALDDHSVSPTAEQYSAEQMHAFRAGGIATALAAPVAPALVPLTDEQIEEMAIQEQFLLVCDDIEALTEIVRAIEAAHGIKP